MQLECKNDYVKRPRGDFYHKTPLYNIVQSLKLSYKAGKQKSHERCLAFLGSIAHHGNDIAIVEIPHIKSCAHLTPPKVRLFNNSLVDLQSAVEIVVVDLLKDF